MCLQGLWPLDDGDFLSLCPRAFVQCLSQRCLIKVEALLLEDLPESALGPTDFSPLLPLVESSITPGCLGLRELQRLELPMLKLGQSWANGERVGSPVV